MKLTLRSLTALSVLLSSFAFCASAQAQAHFNFTFKSSGNTPVGTGTLDLATDPGLGTFVYSTLSPTYAFTINGDSYTQADYVSNPNLSELVISDLGGGLRGLVFSNTGSNGGGPQGGSIDLHHGANITSFSPSGFGGGYYYENSNGVGTYSAVSGDATTTPEPGSVAMFTGMGLTGAAFLRRRKRIRQAA